MKTGDIVSRSVDSAVLGEFDVIVCGGGTAGCIAAIAAARGGASVALIESGYCLGGMMSVGNAGLTKFIKHGDSADAQTEIVSELRRDPSDVQPVGGIPLEITETLIKMKAAVGTGDTGASYVYTDSHVFKMFLFEIMRREGVKVYLHSFIYDVMTEGGRITGVVMHTKAGSRAVLGRFVIDATGDGDVAAAAGVPFVLGAGPEDAVCTEGLAKLGTLQAIGSMFRIGGVDFGRYVEHIKEHPEAFRVQPFGLMTREEFIKAYEAGEMIIGHGVTKKGRWFQIYNYPRPNIMIGCISIKGNRNGLDINELTQAEYDIMAAAKNLVDDIRADMPGFENAFVLDTPQAGVRETRHVEGLYKLNIEDVMTRCDFPDSIGMSCHPVDIQPFPKAVVEHPAGNRFYFHIPYRCLVAKKYENLLLAGRCVSSTREAAGCTRPTVPCMITGEAAGTAAALCVKNGVKSAADVNVEELRSELRRRGAKL